MPVLINTFDKVSTNKDFTEIEVVLIMKKWCFYWQDIHDELLVYTHDGPEDVTFDQFNLSLTDGQFKNTGVVKVVIGVVNDETPRLRINRGLRVNPGKCCHEHLPVVVLL